MKTEDINNIKEPGGCFFENDDYCFVKNKYISTLDNLNFPGTLTLFCCVNYFKNSIDLYIVTLECM